MVSRIKNEKFFPSFFILYEKICIFAKNIITMAERTEILHAIALTQIPLIGNITASKLINACGSAEAVLKENAKKLSQIEHIPANVANSILSAKNMAMDIASREMKFIDEHDVKVFLKSDGDYPKRLLQCIDAPIVLYGKGNFNLNPKYSVAVVGTRRFTEYGNLAAKKIVEDLAAYKGVQIISGLAVGIDTVAHQSSIQHSLPTIAVLGHGLKTIYPSSNRHLAEKMLQNGGILTEFTHDVPIDPHSFPKRNRIIAGMSDAVVVVEAHEKGGALITANIGASYNRDIFAVPGRIGDKASEGCNNLIKHNVAALISSGKDIAEMMMWEDVPQKSKTKQMKLLLDFTPDEQLIVNVLEKGQELNIDELLIATELNTNVLSSTLLMLEFKGIINCLPGKRYVLSL